MKKTFNLIIALTTISLIFLTRQVLLIALLLVIFEKCFYNRVNPLPFGGIEFTTLATILITLKYGLLGGFGLALFIIFGIGMINLVLENKLIVNPNFNPIPFGLGNIMDFIVVIVVYLMNSFDILWITLVVVAIKNSIGKFGAFSPMDIISIPVNIIFNLALVYFLHPWLVALI